MPIKIRLAAFAAVTAVLVGGGTSFGQSSQSAPSYRPSLGVRLLPVTNEIAQDFGLREPRGALVLGVDDQGPAKFAGFEPGDLIVKFDGRDIGEPVDLQRIVADATVGKEVPVVIIRTGEEKTKMLKVGRAALLRTPACEEVYLLADSDPPGALERLFSKRFDGMSASDFEQAVGIVSRCAQAAKAMPQRELRTILGPHNVLSGDRISMSLLSIIKPQLEFQKNLQREREQRIRVADEAALRGRLEAERKATEVRLEAERKAAEVRAKAEECRQQCPQKLVAMLEELRSLGTDERGVKRFRELDREHQALMQQMPADVAQTLSALNDSFVAEYSGRAIAVGKAEEQLRQKKEADIKITEQKEADAKKQKEVEAKIAEQSQQLQLLYLFYMELQVCAERFTQFENTIAGLKDVLKSKEAGLSSEQVDGIWNATAEKFQKLEPALRVAGDAQLYAECDQNSRYVAGLIVLVPGMRGPTQGLPLRKKDF